MSATQTNETDKKAGIFAADFVYETFIAFKGDKSIDYDNLTKNEIMQIQYNLSKCSFLPVCLQKNKSRMTDMIRMQWHLLTINIKWNCFVFHYFL